MTVDQSDRISGTVTLRRGLFRVWIVLSTAWFVGFMIFEVWDSSKFHYMPYQWRVHEWIDIVLTAIFPWLLTIAVIALRWIIAGFRSAA